MLPWYMGDGFKRKKKSQAKCTLSIVLYKYTTCLYIHILRVQRGSEIRPFEIWKHLKSGPFEGQISNGPVFTFSESGCFCQDFKWFWTNGHLSGFPIVGLPDFRSHLKSKPFAIQPLLDHSKSRLDFRSSLYY